MCDTSSLELKGRSSLAAMSRTRCTAQNKLRNEGGPTWRLYRDVDVGELTRRPPRLPPEPPFCCTHNRADRFLSRVAFKCVFLFRAVPPIGHFLFSPTLPVRLTFFPSPRQIPVFPARPASSLSPLCHTLSPPLVSRPVCSSTPAWLSMLIRRQTYGSFLI